MPTIDVEYSEFVELLKMDLHKDLEAIGEVLALAKGEVKLFDEKTGAMNVEIKDTNRPDLWNVEGLARSLRPLLGLEDGLRPYSLDKPLGEVYVDKRLKPIRPFIGCAVVKDLVLTDAMIRGFMQLQDKLDHTYGRNRRRASIGLYDFDLIFPPLFYSVTKPTDVSFVPLGFSEKMNLDEMLEKHPKGVEYGSIVNRHDVYPILLDNDQKVLSFPPIINSNDLGRISTDTKNILIEVTGTNHQTVLNTLRLVTLSLIDRGGKAHSTIIHYDSQPPSLGTPQVTPDFETSLMDLDVEYTNKVLGLKLTSKEIGGLLRKAGFDFKNLRSESLTAQIPCYRTDVMHPVDLIEDVAIAYGYGNIEPFWRKLPTTGSVRPEQRLLDTARELMIGLGFQEVLTYTMSNQENLFGKMNLKKQQIIELANPKVQTLTCLRNWLLPSLMEVLSCNLHVEYPQKIFELGKVTVPDEKSETRTADLDTLGAVICHAEANFSEAKSALGAFFSNLGLQMQVAATMHRSFIEGRCGSVAVEKNRVGIVGEIRPFVLEAWKLENPVAAFQLDMSILQKTIEKKR